jgi:predicted permease
MIGNGALVLEVFTIACSSIGKASLVILAGLLLARRGALTQSVRKGISKMSAGLLVPCLLAERLATTVTPALLAEAWPVLPVGVVYVAIGCSFGAIVSLQATRELRKPLIAASAFANSQAMPIILIEVIAPDLFGDDAAAAVGVAYIGLYLCVYLLLQWTIGAALLNVPLLTVGGGERPPAGGVAPALGVRTSTTIGAAEAPDSLLSVGAARSDAPIGGAGGIQLEALPLDGQTNEEGGEREGREGQVRRGRGHAPRSSRGGCGMSARAVLSRVASPPIYGVVVGLTIALVPPLRWLLVGGAPWQQHDSHGSGEPGQAGHAPLRFVMQAARLLGDAAIPINTMLLGASLSRGVRCNAVPLGATLGVVLTKLALLPAVALGLGMALTRVVRLPPLLLLVMLMQSAMPTANNLMMMCELAGGAATPVMSTVIFAQYVFAPFLLTGALTLFMALVRGQDQDLQWQAAQ